MGVGWIEMEGGLYWEVIKRETLTISNERETERERG